MQVKALNEDIRRANDKMAQQNQVFAGKIEYVKKLRKVTRPSSLLRPPASGVFRNVDRVSGVLSPIMYTKKYKTQTFITGKDYLRHH